MGSSPDLQNSATSSQYAYRSSMDRLSWSPREKAIARKAFERALDREFEAVIHGAQERAANIKVPADLWKLEDYLTRSRKHIDDRYDYRYSVLPLVFADLIRKGRLQEEDLEGLSADKLKLILGVARF